MTPNQEWILSLLTCHLPMSKPRMYWTHSFVSVSTPAPLSQCPVVSHPEQILFYLILLCFLWFLLLHSPRDSRNNIETQTGLGHYSVAFLTEGKTSLWWLLSPCVTWSLLTSPPPIIAKYFLFSSLNLLGSFLPQTLCKCEGMCYDSVKLTFDQWSTECGTVSHNSTINHRRNWNRDVY